MKKCLFILYFCFCFSVQAREVYYCPELYGVTTPLKEKSRIWNKLKWIHHGVEETKTILGDSRIIVDGKNSEIIVGGESTPLILFNDNDDKAELLEKGTVASGIYMIDKVNKKLFYVKNSLVPLNLRKIINIDRGYQMMMTAECK